MKNSSGLDIQQRVIFPNRKYRRSRDRFTNSWKYIDNAANAANTTEKNFIVHQMIFKTTKQFKNLTVKMRCKIYGVNSKKAIPKV